MKLTSIIGKLNTAKGKYDGVVGSAEATISEFTDFEARITFQPSDGFVVGDDNTNNAPLDSCIAIILQKGQLTHKDYLSILV